MEHVLPQPRKPTASWEKLGTVEEMMEGERDDAKSGDAAEDVRSSGWERRPGQNRQQPRQARAIWSGCSVSCRTCRFAVGAGIALLGRGLRRRCQWRKTGCLAIAVERKGAGDPHAVIKLTEWVDALGSTNVAIRSDREPTIKQVAATVRDGRRERAVTTLETSPPGDHVSNGTAERAVGQVAGMVRTLKAELEYNTKGKSLGRRARLGRG